MAVIANTILTTDVAPAITRDLVENLSKGFVSLQEVMGISDMEAVAAGDTVRVYTTSVGTVGTQPAEGDEVALTKVTLAEGTPITMELVPYRKMTTAQAIQKVGREKAINKTDEALLGVIRGEIKKDFYDILETGSGTAEAGTSLQSQLAQNWAAMQVFYKDYGSVRPVHFVNPLDVADYLGTAQITTQNAFGFTYVKDFLGLGTVVMDAEVTEKNVISTASENLHWYYVPANGEVGQEFGMTSDASGLVGMVHTPATDRFSIETLLMQGNKIVPEVLAGVIKGTFGA